MLYLIIFASLLLRLINLNQSFWLDEAININNVSALGFRELFLNYSLSDFHPPLYHLVLKAWINYFGNSEISSRVPSIIFALGSIVFAYLIARKLYDVKTGLIAALLLATAPLHIYYSQEARMYMLAAFLACMSVYFFLLVLERDKLYNWLGFIASTALLLYSDYLPYLLIPVYLIFLFIRRKKIAKHTLFCFIPTLLIILIALIPWLLIFPKQLQTGQSVAIASPAWAQVVGTTTVKDFLLSFVKFTIGRISNDNNLQYGLLFAPAGIFVSALFTISLLRISPGRLLIYFWFLTPPLVAFLISFFIPVFSYFRFIFILPAFYIIWSSAINTVNWALPTRVLLTIAIFINLLSAIIYYTNPRFQRENWREATEYVVSQANENTLILFESGSTAAPFDYYNKGKIAAYGAIDGFNADQPYIERRLQDLTYQKSKIYLFQYLSGITDPKGLVFEQIIKLNFKNTTTRNFEGVGFVYEFTR